MTRTLLKQICRLIWGERYVSDLARHFRVHIATAQRWDNGKSPIPDHIEGSLLKLLDKRRMDIEKILHRATDKEVAQAMAMR